MFKTKVGILPKNENIKKYKQIIYLVFELHAANIQNPH
jgi:hypothetical protein